MRNLTSTHLHSGFVHNNGLRIFGCVLFSPLLNVAVVLGFGVLTVLLILPRAGVISRRRGLALLAAYAAFIATTLSF